VSEPARLVEYPPALIDAVSYAWAGDTALAAKMLEPLDPELVVAQLLAMFGSLAVDYERKCELPKGSLLPRLRARYLADAEIRPLGPPPRKQRRVNR
jgi:hypothetical protein